MKSRRKKRLLAMVLCVVMILSLSISVMAEGGATASDGTESEAMLLSDGAESSETITEPTPEPTAEPTPEVTQTPEATPEVTPEPVTTTPTPTPETVQEDSETVQTDVTTDESQTSDVQNVETQSVTPDSEPVQAVQPYESSYEDNDVVIRVSAEAGIVPEGAVLSVTPIVKREVTDTMTAEEKAEVEAVNAQYDLTEKKLTEDSEKNEEIMEGFLAYDISFLVAGVEVEPSGDVKVTMDFKEAAIPEGVSEDAEVAVKHLKEEAAAEDGVVVEDMAEKADVQTTDKAEVKKVELTAESFSAYTVTWMKPRTNNYRIEITTYYGYLDNRGQFVELDYNGTEIPQWNTINENDYTGGNVELEDYADSITTDNGRAYAFKSAYVANGDYEYDEAAGRRHESKTISVNNNVGNRSSYYFFYQTPDNSWRTLGDALNKNSIKKVSIYFIYEKTEPLTTVETVDNAQGGIKMRMTDHDGRGDGLNDDIKGYYVDGNGYVHQGLLQNQLNDNGYPVTKDGTSLEQLFNGDEVDNLFIKSIYDETGYYEYSSFDNYAYLGDGDEFTVYEQIGTPSNEEAIWYQRGNFMPYNKIEAGKYSTNTNLYNEDGENLKESDSRYNEKLYITQGTNYCFGLSMEVTFSQPEDGMAVHNGQSNPMVYEFNGDDDLWVYIDDVLVLDIGGIHDAHSGYINFSTGAVHVECVKADGSDQNTTIKEIFYKAGVFPDGSEWDDSKVDAYFDGDTFRNYTMHDMKMFYMERGEGASNLHMKFNLQTVPEGTIEVEKDLSNTDKEKYANIEFAFQVWAQEIAEIDAQGNETYSEEDYVLLTNNATKNGENVQFHNNVQIGGEPYDGVFYLKPGETASFSGLQKDRKYYVKEIGVNPGEYDQVTINGTEIISTSEEGETSKITDITSSEDAVGSRPHITFENNCSAANRRELRITKQMAGNQSTTDTFTFRVQLEGTNGSLTDYNGPYYLTDSQGNYWYYNTEGKLESNGIESRVCGTTTDGQITGVPAGYTVAITTILSGTEYKVWEVDPNAGLVEEKYNPPVYTSDDEDATSDENGSYTSGVIELNKNVNITVTNALTSVEDQPMIRVQKTFSGLTEEAIAELADKFSVTVKDSSENTVAILKLGENASQAEMEGVTVSDPTKTGEAPNITYTWEIRNVGSGTYFISEAGADTPGYESPETVYNGEPDNQVTTQQPQFNVTRIDEVSAQSSKEYDFNNVDLIIISLVGNEKEYLVWSEEPLSVGERESLTDAVGNNPSNQIGQFKNSLVNADMDKIVFYSTRQLIQDGFYYRGEISVDDNNYLVFNGGTKQWNQIWLGSYERTGSVDAEIEVVNTYEAATMDVDLQKFGTEYGVGLEGAKFNLYKGTQNGDTVDWDTNPAMTDIEVVNANAAIELKNLATGFYKLEETQAPSNYQLLESYIYFKVDTSNDSLTLVDENGNPIAGNGLSELMWRIDPAGGKRIQIKNESLYSLPSAGGPGIHMYMIGGVLLMSAGVLMIYRNKRREVLNRK